MPESRVFKGIHDGKSPVSNRTENETESYHLNVPDHYDNCKIAWKK